VLRVILVLPNSPAEWPILIECLADIVPAVTIQSNWQVAWLRKTLFTDETMR